MICAKELRASGEHVFATMLYSRLEVESVLSAYNHYRQSFGLHRLHMPRFVKHGHVTS